MAQEAKPAAELVACQATLVEDDHRLQAENKH
jgi:hypothetical protein